jgi:pilus assembly protein Flp/PilA
MKSLVLRFAADDSGATAVEYGIMVALIAVAIILVVQAIGLSLVDVFDDVRLQGLGGN